MSNDKKRAANARYLATKKTITIRMDPAEHKRIQAAADKATRGSVQGYFLQAAREKMACDAAEEET